MTVAGAVTTDTDGTVGVTENFWINSSIRLEDARRRSSNSVGRRDPDRDLLRRLRDLVGLGEKPENDAEESDLEWL